MLRFLSLALLIAAATSQQVAPCRCGAFVTTNSSEVMLYELPPIEVHSCDQSHPCQNRCFEEFEVLSGGGDLDFVTSTNSSVGQVLCDAAGTAVDKQYVYAYSELCDGPWEWTGDVTLQPLCCSDEAEYFPCEVEELLLW
ncbi:uncharacterized protein LOC122258133 [Penaeus japonicus]|uniref:uncharacterized protein LOC122258133 n=1 Tax=Penaeus japonicus TaxID=27405 RepID=UPI001C710364|nr:uncharacterized protein LOC122258133 [Penaeus japonicus]